MNVEQVTQELIECGMSNVTVACSCNKCSNLDWIKVPAEDYAKRVVASNTDLSDIKSMRKLNHTILQGA